MNCENYKTPWRCKEDLPLMAMCPMVVAYPREEKKEDERNSVQRKSPCKAS